MRHSAIFLTTLPASARRVANAATLISLICLTMPVASERLLAADLIVRYDQSQLLRLPRPVAEIIIGNPSIADVSLQGGNLLVVTGKTFGVTNVIALDADRNVIQDQRVLVERDDRKIVNLHKGSSRYTYSCTPNCDPTLTIGDDKTFFETVQNHNSTKKSFSESSAEAPSANAN